MRKVAERIAKSVLRWFGLERIRTDRIGKREYVGECVSSRLVGRPRKMGIDSVNDCLK